ncbi:MAG: histidine kinase, partial [Chloroflexia bacterium]
MTKKQWGLSLLGWLALALLAATQTVVAMRGEGMQHDWNRVFLVVTLQWLPWALATPLVLRLGNQRPVRLRMDLRSALIHAGLCVGIAIAFAVWSSLLQVTFRPWGAENLPPPLWVLTKNRLLSNFHISVLIYAGLLTLGRGLESQRQLAEAQLIALRKQLEPHFLFNTLHGIAGMVREGKNNEAVSMIARLSDLLRQVLDGAERQ